MATIAEEETNPNYIEEENMEEETIKEGQNLLGSPTFKELENGRFKCIETGHEMLAKDMESYSNSKRCRLGLIESFLSQKKPPLNMFKQDPVSKSKVLCKLTGVSINKTEEHIWKHLNGRKFLNKLEQKETEKLKPKGTVLKNEEEPVTVSKSKAKNDRKKKKKKEKKEKEKKEREKKMKDKKMKGVKEDVSEEEVPEGAEEEEEEESLMEDEGEAEELDFWVPPTGSRWDFDDGKDRWASDTESEQEPDEGGEIEEKCGDESLEIVDDKSGPESVELSMRTKRMSIEIGPSSFASRKKKIKTKPSKPSSD